MTKEEKAELIYTLTETDIPTTFTYAQWSQIVHDGIWDNDPNTPILLAVAKCEYAPGSILSEAIKAVPVDLRFYFLGKHKDLRDSHRFTIMGNIGNEQMIRFLSNRGKSFGQYDIDDTFLNYILKRRGYCIEFKNLPYTVIAKDDKTSLGLIYSERFVGEIADQEDVIESLVNNNNLDTNYREKLFDLGCDVCNINFATDKISDNIYKTLSSRIFDFGGEYIKSDKDAEEYENVCKELIKRIKKQEISVENQFDILQKMGNKITSSAYCAILNALLTFTNSDVVLAKAYKLISKHAGPIKKAMLLSKIDSNPHLGKETIHSICSTLIPTNMYKVFLSAIKNGELYCDDLNKLFHNNCLYGNGLLGLEKELAIMYIAEMATKEKSNFDDFKTIKKYGEKYNIPEINTALKIYDICSGKEICNCIRLAAIKLMTEDKRENVAETILGGSTITKHQKDKSLHIQTLESVQRKAEKNVIFNNFACMPKKYADMEIVNILSQNRDALFTYIDEDTYQKIKEKYEKVIAEDKTIKLYMDNFPEILERERKRSLFFDAYNEFFPSYKKSFNIANIDIDLRKLYSFFNSKEKTAEQHAKDFIDDFSKLDKTAKSAIINSFYLRYEIATRMECDLKEKMDCFCNDIVSFFIAEKVKEIKKEDETFLR